MRARSFARIVARSAKRMTKLFSARVNSSGVAPLALLAAIGFAHAAEPGVSVVRVPGGGMKPSLAVDDRGTLHLAYFTGKPDAGDIEYVTSRDQGRTFSSAQRVNSQPGCVQGMSSIRGPQLAIGRNNRPHIVWIGAAAAQPRLAMTGELQAQRFANTPLLYARATDDGSAFEPQRNVVTRTCNLDGNAIAADRAGNVYVVWHGSLLDDPKDEPHRAVWVALSTDDGHSFAPEKNALPIPTGACGCCTLNARVDSHGALAIIYRIAADAQTRDQHLLFSNDHGATFTTTKLDTWKLPNCPMSSAALATHNGTLLAAWENAGKIRAAPISEKMGTPWSVSGASTSAKTPAIAMNRRGEILFAWTEGTGWGRGGIAVWRVFNDAGEPLGNPGRAEGVPAHGSVAAFAGSDDTFVVVF
jgi:hypothetical protein